MTEDQLIAATDQIERFMGSEAWKEAIRRVESKYIAAWREAKTRDTREDYHARISVLDDVKASLESVKGDGQIAKRQKEQRLATEIATKRRGQ
jgi:hypothetical protein